MYSNNSQGGGFGSLFANIPPVTKNLLLINIAVFAVMAIVPGAEAALDRWCALYYFSSPGFYPFQIFTYMFLHGSFMHLFFNMFALWMFGRTIEYTMGSARFLFFYITCGIGAGLIQEGIRPSPRVDTLARGFAGSDDSGLLPPPPLDELH